MRKTIVLTLFGAFIVSLAPTSVSYALTPGQEIRRAKVNLGREKRALKREIRNVQIQLGREKRALQRAFL